MIVSITSDQLAGVTVLVFDMSISFLDFKHRMLMYYSEFSWLASRIHCKSFLISNLKFSRSSLVADVLTTVLWSSSRHELRVGIKKKLRDECSLTCTLQKIIMRIIAE